MVPIGIAALFFAVICGLAVRGLLPLVIPAIYLVAGIASAIAYARDKAAAERGAWRTRERTLHVLAVAGGWPGALIAQTLFRHKSRKPAFRIAFWTTVALNCGALAWFLWATRS